MGRMFLGAATAELSFDVASSTLNWNTLSAAHELDEPIRIYATNGARTVFAEGRSGSQRADWTSTPDVYNFEMESAGRLVKVLRLDTTTSPWQQSIIYDEVLAIAGEIPPGPPPPGNGNGGGGAPDASWFEQSTNIFGVDIPNLGLVAGGGLLLLAALRKKG